MSFEILENIIELSKKEGADHADVIMSTGESLSLSAFEGKIDKFKVSGSKMVGIRVIKNNRVGISYSESFDQDALKFMVKSATQNSEFSEKNEFETIEKTESFKEIKDHSVLEEIPMSSKIELALSLEKEVFNRNKLVQSVPYTGYSDGKGQKFYMNSLGNSFSEASSNYNCYTSALLKEGSESSMHYESACALKFSDLNWNKCVDESLIHAKEWLKGESLTSGKYDIIFTIDCLSSIFGCFEGIYSGKRASDNNNPFSEKLGKVIAHSELTITDSPNYSESFFPSFFDDEGFHQKEIKLVENGILNEFLHNTYSSKKLKLKNNFRASRGAKSALGVSSTNVVIKAGKSSSKELLEGEYIEVHALQGLHSGANFFSGEFSFAATGYLCKDGVRVRPVKGITVAGNFYKMLNSIKNLGSELEAVNTKSFFAPKMRFTDLYVAGK